MYTGEYQVRRCRASTLDKLLLDAEVLSSNSHLAAAHYNRSFILMATEQLHWGQMGLKTTVKGSRSGAKRYPSLEKLHTLCREWGE